MKFFNTLHKLLTTITTAGVLLGAMSSQAQTSISGIGTSYTQNFNTLTVAGSWTDNSTIPGWYAQDTYVNDVSSFSLSTGSSVTPGLVSYGNSSDRALGFAPDGLNFGGEFCIGWRMKNETGVDITHLDITWTGEQWKDGDTDSQPIILRYFISSDPINTIDRYVLTDVLDATFTSPSTTNAGALDGNNSANRLQQTHTVTASIPNGSEIILVWVKSDQINNHLLAIDDISITARSSTPQTITFPPASNINKTYGDAAFALTATASSGLIVSYTSSDTNVATISGSTVTINGPGATIITASQAGNSTYAPATNVTKTLYVKPLIPTVSEATNIGKTTFTANWSIDNGNRESSTRYTIQYADNPSYTGLVSVTNLSSKSHTLSGLTEGNVYYYRIQASNSGLVSGYTSASTVTTGGDYSTSSAGTWENTGSWVSGEINNIANSITINHSITSSSSTSITTNTLHIKPTGKLNTTQNIFVTNQLIIESDASGNTGQILNTGTITVGANAKIIVRKGFNANQWYFMGFPFNVNAANIYAEGTSTLLSWGDYGGSGDFFVAQYNGTQRDATGLENTTGPGLNWQSVSGRQFVAKKGYIVRTGVSRKIDFTLRGENKADIFSTAAPTATLGMYTNNSSAMHHSWNLVTPPYVTSYELATTTTNAPYYVFNGINYDIKLAGETLEVLPFTSFFLQASATSMSFASAGKRVKAPAARNSLLDEIYLRLTNGNSTYDDKTRIRLLEGASTDYEIGKDASKIFGTDPNISYIYSTINNYAVAINTLPRTVTQVDLRAKLAAANKYTLSLEMPEKAMNYAAIYLIDKVTGTSIDLKSNNSYTFTANAAGYTDRFRIQLAPQNTTGIISSEKSNIRISTDNNSARIYGIELADVKIVDISGKQVYNDKVKQGEPIQLNKGMYMFNITEGENQTQIKTIIK